MEYCWDVGTIDTFSLDLIICFYMLCVYAVVNATCAYSSRSKYVLVPRGNGLDTHRVYESMYFNAIPIVLTGQFDHFYEHLPVLIVQSWSEINEEYLRLNYVKLRVRLTNWKRTNSHWKRVDFWLPDLKQYKRKRRKQARREASHNDRNETIGIDGSSKGDKLRGGAKREEEDDDDT